MASKRGKTAPTDDELGELFEGLSGDNTAKKTSKKAPAGKGKTEAVDRDILAELESELVEKAPSRPHTPRIREPTPAKRPSSDTPPPEEKALNVPRKSGDSMCSHHASFTPSAASSDLQESEKKGMVEKQAATSGDGGGWWGGLLSTASAAMKQAEAAVKDIQQREEAKKWADQVRGNVGALRGLGDELRHRALPTFTNILHTIAPPISSHERLLVHITHDFVGYPSIDPLVHSVFSRVMAQVEGGDLLVIQRGQESTMRSPVSDKASQHPFFVQLSSYGWRDGPWWRQVGVPRDLGLVKGLAEGTKLCRASAEGYSIDYLAGHGGIEMARRRASEPLSESNPVRSSDLFLGVQAIAVEADNSLFAGTSASEKEKMSSAVREEDAADEMVCFALYVLDPVHEIQYATVSQSLPARWIRWLDAPTLMTPASEEGDEAGVLAEQVPQEIREIIESGGVDPREWVAEWIEETLSLATGVVAQRYVARRMGVGEGGIGKGKAKIEDVREGLGQ